MGTLEEPQWVFKPDYYEAENIPRAVHCARSVARGMLAGLVDPVVWREEVEVALEVLCDAPGGSPMLALRAIKAMEPRFRRPEQWEIDNRTSNAVRYACWATLMAEVAHRCQRYAEAVILTSTAFDILEEAAEGSDALMRLVASSKVHPLAGATTAVYAIRVAALRRARYLTKGKDHMRERTRAIVPAYLASGRTDPRSHAFATQVLFDQVEQGNYEHLADLRSISNATRGSSMRSWTTEPLVVMEHNRALGDIPAAKRAAKEAEDRIRSFGLWRHLEVVTRYGYLTFD